MRIIVNVFALVLELALIVAVAYVGATSPEIFALLTAFVALAVALGLEYARIVYEMPFYFGRRLTGVAAAGAVVWVALESVFKSMVAAFVALLTFSGTDENRLFWISILFAACLLVGTTALLRIGLNWGELAVRWGYFRLAVPLGFLYSAGIYGLTQAGKLPAAGFDDVAFDATFNLPARPTIDSASEFLFKLTQATDSLIAALLSVVIPSNYVPLVQIVASTNVLPGFVLAVFTVAIVRMVQSLHGERSR